MNETYVTMRGSVGTDPVQRTLSNGTTVTSFRLGSTERRWDRAQNQYADGRSLWITITCWRTLALNVAASVRKGQRVIVRGRLVESEWEVEGARRSRIELEAETVGHDLQFGTAGFSRTGAEGMGQRAQSASPVQLFGAEDEPAYDDVPYGASAFGDLPPAEHASSLGTDDDPRDPGSRLDGYDDLALTPGHEYEPALGAAS